jgi:hypothetical protein
MIEALNAVKSCKVNDMDYERGGAAAGGGSGRPGRPRPGTYVAALLFAAILAGTVAVRVLAPSEQRERGTGTTQATGTTRAAGSGVHGTVTLREGDCQPGVVGEPGGSGCRVHPASRRVHVYSPPIGDGAVEGAYYHGGRRPTSVGRSDSQGKYAIDLPAGSYTILVEDDGRFYCHSFEGGRACAVTVRAGERVRRDLEIDHGSF